MTTEAKNYHVAKEILNQLGGNRFAMMTGSKNFGASENKLSMQLTRNASGANYLTITLTPMDVYTMEFISVRAGKRTVKKVVENVYNDMLQRMFTDATGLYTRL
tara:strand:+ start:512 stop:823 length:312 start_codon:yes stop_codon:yes gene_type:complete